MLAQKHVGGLVLLLFACSGATALIYEVIWSKFLSQMFGSTIQAQTVVLAVFMGGLALGNRLFGSKSDRLISPVRTYGFMEMAIGFYAFFFVGLYSAADSVFVTAGARVLEHRGLLLSLKAILSVMLLAVPTILMGGTLPMLAAWLKRTYTDAGQQSARFYSVNSLGAVAGAGLAGFYLVPTAGMVATLQLTALVNVMIGGAAILLSRPQSGAPAVDGPIPAPEASESPIALRWAIALVTITGGISMGLEVLAARCMALIFGSSLQSFSIVLMAFILGIGLGSAIMASPRQHQSRNEKRIALLLLAAAAWIGLVIFKIELWVDVYRVARSGLGRSPVGYVFHQFLAGGMSLILLGVPAALLGAVLPLLMRVVSRQVTQLGTHVGQLLTWNTMGSVVGVLCTGFILMPVAGLRNSFGLLALALCAAAIWTARRGQWFGGMAWGGGVTGLLGLFFVLGGENWRHVMSAGAFRAKENVVDFNVMQLRREHVRILFYEDAADATVSVDQGDGVLAPNDVGLRINGKADASSRADMGTQLLMGHLPLLAKPDSKDVFILGLGAGVTGAAVLGHPVERLTVAENCEPVVRASKFFEPWNRGVLKDPRTRLWHEDARTILKLSPQQYDVIITQPSNPWTAGVGSVFSREYFELAASRLKPGGIMAQWFHLYDMHDGIVSLVLRTFSAVFPQVEIWDPGGGDIILLGSMTPWLSTPETYRRGFERAMPRTDLTRVGIGSPEALLARQLASQQTAFAIAGDGPLQTDLFPVLEYQAPRAFFLGVTSKMLSQYDERTWQSEHASAQKRRALESLPIDSVKNIFKEFQSINEELLHQLSSRIQKSEQAAHAGAWLGLGAAPCAFLPEAAEAGAPAPIIPADATDDIKRLLAALAWLAGDDQHKAQGVNEIEALLRNRRPDATWAPAHYATLAAKVSLGLGHVDKAKVMVKLGQHYSPDDEQLSYLARILERRQSEPTSKKLAQR